MAFKIKRLLLELGADKTQVETKWPTEEQEGQFRS